MVKLTQYEQEMLNGDYGRFKQKAIDNIVKYAEALGAEELCEVTKATIYLGAHPYLEAADSDDYNKIFSKMYMCTDEVIEMGDFSEGCFCQTCVAPCSQHEFEPLGLTKEFFDKNNEFLNITKEAGVSITGTCTPYLTGWIPLMGEHFVTTESSNVLFSNAVFGACGNSDGIEAAAWSGICGRTPKWGNHIMENRKGTHVFEINCPSETAIDWDVIGYTIGRMLPPHAIPVISGNFKRPDTVRLKQCFAALATTSGGEMCHIVGITPEARTLEMAMGGNEPKQVFNVSQEEYDISMKMLCDEGNGEVDFIVLGCPHYTLEELRDTAKYIKGKKVKDGVFLNIWTDYSTKAMAEENGYLKDIEDAGGHLLTSGCPLVIGHKCHESATGMVMDGAKQAHYIRSETTVPVYYGDRETCIDAAITGKWEA